MIERLRFIWQLLLLSSILLILGLLLLSRLPIQLSSYSYLATLISVTVINMVVFLLMHRGIGESGRKGGAIVLTGIGAKFLLYLLFILTYWLITKNLDKPFIVSFFALYLIFTFFLAISLLKLLKNN